MRNRIAVLTGAVALAFGVAAPAVAAPAPAKVAHVDRHTNPGGIKEYKVVHPSSLLVE